MEVFPGIDLDTGIQVGQVISTFPPLLIGEEGSTGTLVVLGRRDDPGDGTYHIRLTDGTAWGQSKTVALEFWLCESPGDDVAGCIWSEPHEAVPIEDG